MEFIKRYFIYIILIELTFACNGKKEMFFEDFVAVDTIERVHMSNNSGAFFLNTQQLEQFKKQLASTVYDPNMSAKVGAISMTLTIKGKEYHIYTSTHGEYLEVDKNITTKNLSDGNTIFFKTNGINFDNYQNLD